MDLSMITAVTGGLADIVQLVKSAKDARLEFQIRERVAAMHSQLSEISRRLYEAEAEKIACQEQVVTLREEVARLVAFDAEKERYALQQIGTDSFAYLVKPGAQRGEPTHALCCTCFAQSVKSILTFNRYEPSRTVLRCPRCGAEAHRDREPDLPEWRTEPGTFDD